MVMSGRWAIIELRRYGDIPLAAVEPPHHGFPCTIMGGHTLGIYAGSPHRDLGALFMAFLASEAYNLQVVRNGDSLPPVPRFTEGDAFKRPPEHPNEWGVHEVFARDALYNGITFDISPFCSVQLAGRELGAMRSSVLSKVVSPDQAALRAAQRIHAEIRRNLAADPALQAEYDRRLRRQERIRQRREAGEPVPLAWIDNPFHRKLYRERGWASAELSP
jgi:multiple sugar transport system substrate-binding protein